MPLTMVSPLTSSILDDTHIEFLHSFQPSFRLWVQYPRLFLLSKIIESTIIFHLNFFIKLNIDFIPLELGPASLILHKALSLLPKLLHSSSHPHPASK